MGPLGNGSEQVETVSLEQLRVLQGQVREAWLRFRKECSPLGELAEKIKTNRKPAWLSEALDIYEYLVAAVGDDATAIYVSTVVEKSIPEVEQHIIDLDAHKMRIKLESLERVTAACDGKQRVVNFMPVEGSIIEAIEDAKEKKDIFALELLIDLREMSVGEFTVAGKSIVRELKTEYCDLVRDINEALNHHSFLSDVLREEIEKLAVEVLGATEEQAQELTRCLAGC